MITTRRGIFAAIGLASLAVAPAAWAATSSTKTKKKTSTKHPQTASSSHKHGKHTPAAPATADATSGGLRST